MLKQMLEQMQDTETKAKSVKLTAAELKRLKLKAGGFTTLEAAAIWFGVGNRNTLSRIMAYGSGSEDYVSKIRAKLSAQ